MNNIWHQKLLDVKREAFIISANIKHNNKYDYNGSEHKYYPDVFLSNNNTIIETKSTWTWNNEVNKNKSKIKGVIESGYNMRIIIWNGKHELVTDSFYSKQKSD